MAIPTAFLDELRARTLLSGLIGRSVPLTKAGREFKACCPFHNEKSPSFTVNDDKGFYHCFGCGAHGDAIRWLVDHEGSGFLDAVRALAEAASLEVPAPSPEQAERQASREAQAATVRDALEVAQRIFAAQLEQAGAVMEYLAGRAIGPAEVASFGLGYARAAGGSLKGSGVGEKLGLAAGLLARREDGSLREMFIDRVTVPIHDSRGRLSGFGARVWPGRRGETPKFLNSPDGPLFDKGRTLFNLHRAAPLARPATPARPEAEGRLLVVEGYFDVIALARAGIHAAVAPMGTALTEMQLQRAWRLHHRPVLLFDGDSAGRKAAVRAAKLALAWVGPGHELAVALLPEGKDPDDLLRVDVDAGRTTIEAAIAAAAPLHEFLFDSALRGEL